MGLDTIDPLIQHLKGPRPYDQTGTYKLYDALKHLDERIGKSTKSISGLQEVTSQVKCNVELIQFGPDQGIISAIVNENLLLISFQCSFKVSVSSVPAINITLPFPADEIIMSSTIAAPVVYQFGPETGAGTTIGTMYQDFPGNVISIYRNDYSPWLANINNIYAAGQIILPLPTPGKFKSSRTKATSTGNTTIITVEQNDHGVRYVDSNKFGGSGTEFGVRVQNAVNDLPANGGVVNAVAYEGSINVDSNMFATVNKPVLFVFGGTQFHCSVAQILAACSNIRVLGLGVFSNPSTSLSTSFYWNGPAGGTVLTLDRVRDSRFEGFSIIPANSIGIGIRIDHVNPPSGAFLSSNNNFKYISIGASTAGIQIGNSSVGNNDLHNFEDINIYDAGTYGIYVYNGQSNIRVLRGSIGSRTYGAYVQAGKYDIDYTNMSLNDTDFYIASAPGCMLIKNINSESAKRFIETGNNSIPFDLTLLSNRWNPSTIHSDGQFIKYFYAGTITLKGNNFADNQFDSNAKVNIGNSSLGWSRILSEGNTYPNKNVFTNNPSAANADLKSTQDIGMIASNVPDKMTNV